MYNKDFFSAFLEDARDLFKDLNKVCDEYENCSDDEPAYTKVLEHENDKDLEYYHFVKDKYENGVCVDHQEKIIEDGKVVKDEHDSIDEKKEEKRTIGSEILKAKNNEIDKLKEEIIELKKENESLKTKLSQIKNMFN